MSFCSWKIAYKYFSKLDIELYLMVEHSLRSLHSRDHNSSRCIPVTVDLCTPPLTLSQTGGAATPSSKITMLLQEFIVNVSAVDWSQDSVPSDPGDSMSQIYKRRNIGFT